MKENNKTSEYADLFKAYVTGLKRGSGSQYYGQCPFHNDKRASFSVNLDTGLWSCKAGCGSGNAHQFKKRVESEGTSAARSGANHPKAPLILLKAYTYKDENGAMVYEVCRFEGKEFRQRRPDGRGGCIYDMKGVRKVLYRLPELLSSGHEDPVFIVEGEKDVETLKSLGLVATCNVGGAGKWLPEYNPYLKDRKVVIVPDNDIPGRKSAWHIASQLRGVAKSIKIVELPCLTRAGEDVSDWIENDNSQADLIALSEITPEIPIKGTGHAVSTEAEWPEPLGEAAYYGLAGEFVRMVEPHSEGDPAAILLQFLTGIGNLIGRKVGFLVGATPHFPNLFLTLVGDTATGRKGTSWAYVKQLLSELDADWRKHCLKSGLSSGEGLIYHVRDPRTAFKDDKKTGKRSQAVYDDGVEDKRLLSVEEEFGAILRLMEREGNILSTQIRNAWDTGDMQTLTKQEPVKATGAHISLICQITRAELLNFRKTLESPDGFANRFLWCCARRSKFLPHGGALSTEALESFISKIRRTLAKSLLLGAHFLVRDEKARKLWEEVYEDLSEVRPGLLKAALSRGAPQVMRLALIYAVLDGVKHIQVPHLEAALEIWRYAEDSVGYIFGAKIDDPLHDKILAILREYHDGIKKSDLSVRLVGKHSRKFIEPALQGLREQGLIFFRYQGTGPARAECWFATPSKGHEG